MQLIRGERWLLLSEIYSICTRTQYHMKSPLTLTLSCLSLSLSLCHQPKSFLMRGAHHIGVSMAVQRDLSRDCGVDALPSLEKGRATRTRGTLCPTAVHSSLR